MPMPMPVTGTTPARTRHVALAVEGLRAVAHVTAHAAPAGTSGTSGTSGTNGTAGGGRAAPGAARPVVLVHGVGSSARAFRRVVGPLSRYGDVHAIDLPGFGAAPPAPHDVTVTQHAAVVAAYVRAHVLAHGGDRPVLVGHSMGTQIVGHVLVDHPDAAAAGVLVGPTADRTARTLRQQAARLARDAVAEPPSAVGVLLWDTLVRSGLPYYLTQLRLNVLTDPLEELLPRTTAPVVVLRGDRDAVAPAAWARELVGVAPVSTLRTGHGRHHVMDSDQLAVVRAVEDAWAMAAATAR